MTNRDMDMEEERLVVRFDGCDLRRKFEFFE